MNYIVQMQDGYDKKLKIQGGEITCYSKDALKKQYENGGYKILGETKKLLKIKNKDKKQYAFYEDELLLQVEKPHTYSRLLYRKVGYLNVGDDNYITVLKSRILLLLFSFLLALLTTLGIIFILQGEPTGNKLPSLDPYVEPLPPTQEEDNETEVGGGHSVNLTYVLKANVSLKTSAVGVYFGNPAKSNQDIVLELYATDSANEILLATSGRITPGNVLTAMKADKEALASLREGNYIGYFRVICYDSENGARALVEPKVTDVEINVIE